MSEFVLPSSALPASALKAYAVGAVIPAIVAGAGERAARRFLEFFAATIRNPNTRAAYHRAVVRFFAWCEAHGLDELALIEPLHVAAYVEQLGRGFEKPTVKQHLAAVRMLFNWLAAGFPDRLVPRDAAAARTLAARTLTGLYNDRPDWLAEAHRALDEAVAAAWPADILTDEALRLLLELNLARSAPHAGASP